MNAHPLAQGSLEIEILKEKVRVHASIPMEEVFVQNAVPNAQRVKGVEREVLVRHGDYLLQHLRFFADDQPLAGRVIEVSPPPPSGLYRAGYTFEYTLAQPPMRVRLEQDVLNEFDFAPGNRWEATYVVRSKQPGHASVEGLLLTSRDPLTIECGASSDETRPPSGLNKWRLTREYLRHGILHILTGYDHLLFICALVLAVSTVRDLVKVVTAFTLAHSLTLTLSVLNIVRLPEQIVEPMIAASIVFVALQNVFWPKRSRGTARLAVAFFFGLFHGLGFAGGLLDAMQGMAGLTIGLAIVAFSLGVEIGHQVVVLPVFGALKLVRWQDRGPLLAENVLRYGSGAISVAGLFYLVAALR